MSDKQNEVSMIMNKINDEATHKEEIFNAKINELSEEQNKFATQAKNLA